MDRRRKVELFEEIRREYRWSRYDSCGREEAGRASADGATGPGQCDSAGAQTGGAKQAEAGPGDGVH